MQVQAALLHYVRMNACVTALLQAVIRRSTKATGASFVSLSEKEDVISRTSSTAKFERHR